MSSTPALGLLALPFLSVALMAIAMLEAATSRSHKKNPKTLELEQPQLKSCVAENPESRIQHHPGILYSLFIICLLLPVSLILLFVPLGVEQWLDCLPLCGTYWNGALAIILLLRGLRWEHCERDSKETARWALLAAAALLAILGTGSMLFFSVRHPYLQSVALVLFQVIPFVGIIVTCFMFQECRLPYLRPQKSRAWFVAVGSMILVAFIVFDFVLLLKAPESSGKRNVAGWFLSLIPPLCAELFYIFKQLKNPDVSLSKLPTARANDIPNSAHTETPHAKAPSAAESFKGFVLRCIRSIFTKQGSPPGTTLSGDQVRMLAGTGSGTAWPTTALAIVRN